METVSGFLGAVPFDWFIVAGFVIMLTLDSLRSGIGRTAAIAIALPIALHVHGFIASAAVLGGMGLFTSSAFAAAMSIAVFFVGSYSIVRRMGIDFFDSGIGEPIQAVIASAAAMAIVLVFWLSTPELRDIWTVGPQLQALLSEPYRLFWLIGGYAALVFARG